VPGLAPSLAATVPGLVESCGAAVASLAVGDRVLLVTSGPRLRDDGASPRRPTLIHPPGTPISAAPLTGSNVPDPFETRLPGVPRSDGVPPTGDGGDPGPSDGPGVGIIVGAALLAAAGIQIPTTAVEMGTEVGAAGPLVEALFTAAGDAERVVLLVIAEGSAARGSDFPADGPDAAQDLDRTLARALAAGDPAALATAVRTTLPAADSLMFTAGPAFAVLARLTMRDPPSRAELRFDCAPLGVGYFVANWLWE
jgi:hypothetical protein